MSYGVKIEKMIAGAASYVDRILRGALPNCLFKPQPNLSWSCAKKLCAIRPATAPALLARADEVISRDAMSASGCGHAEAASRCPLLGYERT
jgi:putative tryptophan/tyrosine transport system substrate-binding protein